MGDASPSLGSGPREELWLLRPLSSNREAVLLREQLSSEISEREQLLNVVSHELRTPVTVIRGYNNLLLSSQVGALNEEQRAFVDESNRSCERLNRFIGDLMSCCGEEQHGLSPKLSPGPVEPLVRGVLAFLLPLLEERGLRVEVDLDPRGLPIDRDSIPPAVRYTSEGDTLMPPLQLPRRGDGRRVPLGRVRNRFGAQMIMVGSGGRRLIRTWSA